MEKTINKGKSSMLYISIGDYAHNVSDMETFAVFIDNIKGTLLGTDDLSIDVDADHNAMLVAFDGSRPDDAWIIELFSLMYSWFRENVNATFSWLDNSAHEFMRYVNDDRTIIEYSIANETFPKKVTFKDLKEAFDYNNQPREVGEIPETGNVDIKYTGIGGALI